MKNKIITRNNLHRLFQDKTYFKHLKEKYVEKICTYGHDTFYVSLGDRCIPNRKMFEYYSFEEFVKDWEIAE